MPETAAEVLARRAHLQRALGARLADARRAAGLTQLDAARRLGVPQSRIAKIEAGVRAVSFVEALEFAEAYGIRPSTLDPR